MYPVSDDQVRAYVSHVTRTAYPYVGRAGAELDDLVQEGLIAVWQSLQDGITPSTAYIEMAMRIWVKKLRRQREMMPMVHEDGE